MDEHSARELPVLLIIAYHFPPDPEIGGARPFRFYKYLKRFGYRCHVLTAAQPNGAGLPEDVEYVADPLRTRPRVGAAWHAERLGWKTLLRTTELRLAWSREAAKRGQAFLRTHADRDVVIISTAPPLGPHLAAWRLAGDGHHKWIADFRDPIHNSVGDQAVLQPLVGPWLEARLLGRADLSLACTDAMLADWTRRFPRWSSRFRLLWNGFDPEDTIEVPPLPQRQCKFLSHVGELYAGRTIAPIVASVMRLVNGGSLAPGVLHVQQIGSASADNLPTGRVLDDAVATGCFQLHEQVPPAQARALATDSDGLLLLQPGMARQVPAKLFEYLRIGRPILAYVTRNSPVESILERAAVPYVCVYADQTDAEMDQRILHYVSLLDGQAHPTSKWFVDTFDGSRQVVALAGLIASVNAATTESPHVQKV